MLSASWYGPALFSIRTYAASMTAFYIALAVGLDRPYWAMASVYIASQPFSGATRSKAVYRLMGTALGAIGAVVLVPNLVDAPALLTVAIALWVATCLYLALLDRTPRSYVFMLAGYTTPIIGFPSVDSPGSIFLTAADRVQEIGLGILVASLAASLILPRSVAPVLARRLDEFARSARTWAISVVQGDGDRPETRRERRRLAADVAEIDLLLSYLGWDPAAAPDAVRTLSALRRRMLTLLPVLSSTADRIAALAEAGALDRLRPALDGVRAWLETPDQVDPPPELRATVAADPAGGRSWPDLLRTSLLQRLTELLDLVHDVRLLRRHLHDGGPFPPPLSVHPDRTIVAVRDRDHGRALWSGAAAALATTLVCAFWIRTEWTAGSAAAINVAVACSFFAALDDPVPAIVRFLAGSAVGIAFDFLYLFVLLPPVGDFVMLAAVLAPALLVAGVLMVIPRTQPIGMSAAVNGLSLLALQSTYDAQFSTFLDTATGTVLGLVSAALITAIVRSVGAEWSAMQLMRRTWADLAAAAERDTLDRAQLASLLLDRLGLLAPRIAVASPDSPIAALDTLAELRVGLNIVSLRQARRDLAPAARGRIDAVLHALAVHYAARSAGRHDAALPAVLQDLDQALASVDAGVPDEVVLALVGIRRGLFPSARPFAAEAAA